LSGRNSEATSSVSTEAADFASRALFLAPLIFVCHFLEESNGFVPWFNSHVQRGITPGLFWSVNITALFITLLVVGVEWASRSAVSLTLVVAWFSFLMFANALFHIAGALVDRSYMPGLVTALVLYIPYFSWLFVRALRSGRVGVVWLVVAAVLGATPMLVHGFLIVFRGSRLF
jgi:hypothetical protein